MGRDYLPSAIHVSEVDIVEPLGHEVIVYCKIGEDRVVAKLTSHRAPAMGESIELAVELDKIQLFDAETELSMAS